MQNIFHDLFFCCLHNRLENQEEKGRVYPYAWPALHPSSALLPSPCLVLLACIGSHIFDMVRSQSARHQCETRMKTGAIFGLECASLYVVCGFCIYMHVIGWRCIIMRSMLRESTFFSSIRFSWWKYVVFLAVMPSRWVSVWCGILWFACAFPVLPESLFRGVIWAFPHRGKAFVVTRESPCEIAERSVL